MHKSVIEWTSLQVAKYNLNQSKHAVLEVGSRDVNGTVRPFFEDTTYIGVDFIDGPGVDITMNAHDLQFASHLFDVVISTEMLEHDEAFWISMTEMGRVLKSGGYLIITARGNGFPLHDFPGDYWRFMPQSFSTLLTLAGCEPLEVSEDPMKGHPGVFGVGRKY